MTMKPLISFDRLPFHIGAASTPSNGKGLPDELPFELEYDQHLGLVRQAARDDVLKALRAAYSNGSILGTAMDDTPLGRGYANDFLAFVEENVSPSPKPVSAPELLEIGAGRGYLQFLLKECGWSAVGLEPGKENAEHWCRFGVNVLCDFFPSPNMPGPYRVIVSYGVLEHNPDPVKMIRDMAFHLTYDGLVLLAVPNDASDLKDGNLSMLVHEHFSYFTPRSLAAVIRAAGLVPLVIRSANYGGALYCAARLSGPLDKKWETQNVDVRLEYNQAKQFCRKASRIRSVLENELYAANVEGRSAGFFCAARALNLIKKKDGFRWFDDDPDLQGRYYPPFLPPIESREALLSEGVDELYILSRTFGEKLKSELKGSLSMSECKIHIMDDILVW